MQELLQVISVFASFFFFCISSTSVTQLSPSLPSTHTHFSHHFPRSVPMHRADTGVCQKRTEANGMKSGWCGHCNNTESKSWKAWTGWRGTRRVCWTASPITSWTPARSHFCFLSFSFLFGGWDGAVSSWSFSALHHTLFAPNPAERMQAWLCANPLKTFKAFGANPSVPAASPWHYSSLVSELTLRVCSHEMWSLLSDQRCSPCAQVPPASLAFDWRLTGEALGAAVWLEGHLPHSWSN